jgi:hypothetical protein
MVAIASSPSASSLAGGKLARRPLNLAVATGDQMIAQLLDRGRGLPERQRVRYGPFDVFGGARVVLAWYRLGGCDGGKVRISQMIGAASISRQFMRFRLTETADGMMLSIFAQGSVGAAEAAEFSPLMPYGQNQT